MSRDPFTMNDPERNYLFSRPWTDTGIPDNALAARMQELQAARLRQMRRRFSERQQQERPAHD